MVLLSGKGFNRPNHFRIRMAESLLRDAWLKREKRKKSLGKCQTEGPGLRAEMSIPSEREVLFLGSRRRIHVALHTMIPFLRRRLRSNGFAMYPCGFLDMNGGTGSWR